MCFSFLCLCVCVQLEQQRLNEEKEKETETETPSSSGASGQGTTTPSQARPSNSTQPVTATPLKTLPFTTQSAMLPTARDYAQEMAFKDLSPPLFPGLAGLQTQQSKSSPPYNK